MTTDTDQETIIQAPAAGPHIYVRCLASYNHGVLHGAWIDANMDGDSIYQEIKTRVLETSPHNGDDWAIHDCSGFGSWMITHKDDASRRVEVFRADRKLAQRAYNEGHKVETIHQYLGRVNAKIKRKEAGR